jgi:hypothetical protein
MPTSGTNETLRKVGSWMRRHPVETILLTVILSLYAVWRSPHHHNEQSQESPAKTQTKPNVSNAASVTPKAADGVNGTEDMLTAANKFALNLENNYKSNGLDVKVRAGIDNSFVLTPYLALTSYLFEDAEVREAYAAALLKERKNLCGVGIWYVRVGYSNAMSPSGVTKDFSLGCPAEGVAYIQKMAPEREKAALELSTDGVQGSVKDRTLLFESNFFSKPMYCEPFVRGIVSAYGYGNSALGKKKLCYIAVDRVQLTYHGKVMKTVPIVCK